MPEHRLPCSTPGCPNTIQPATSRRTGGLCGPCAGRRAKAEWDQYVRANRRDVDRYAGVTDPVQLLLLMHQPPKYDPLVNLVPPPKSFDDLYSNLTQSEADRLITHAANSLRDGNTDIAESAARCLAAFTEFALDDLLTAMIDSDHLWPSIAFRNAPPVIRDQLLAMNPTDPVRRQHVLVALAWVGDDVVASFFRDADRALSDRRRALDGSYAEYAHYAGWEFTPDGRRRDLFSRNCLAIHPAPQALPAADSSPVEFFAPAAGKCPQCHRPLTYLLRTTSHDARLAPVLGGQANVAVLTCDVCTCFANPAIVAAQQPDGTAHWHTATPAPRVMPEKPDTWLLSPWSRTAPQLVPRRPIHGADWLLPTTFSQLGGLPAWVQHPTYPTCPDCYSTMTFLAQLDNAAFPAHEGIYYAFICRTCPNTATLYQQT